MQERSDESENSDKQSDLFIFSYTDLIDMPETLYQTHQNFPCASFLFIPTCFMKPAFKLMNKIFERHDKRRKFYEANPTDPNSSVNMQLFSSPALFIGTIQQTLMSELGVPVSVITAAPTVPVI